MKKEIEKKEEVKEEDVKEEEVEEDEGGVEVDGEVEKNFKKLLDSHSEGVKASLKAELSTEISKLINEEVERKQGKAGIYNQKVQKEEAMGVKNEKLKRFFVAVLSGDFASIKAESTTDASGTPYNGYVVDSELSAEIRHLTTEYGVARREMTTMQLSKNSYKANELVTDVSTYWVDEGGSIKSSQVVLGQNTLELNKLATVVALTAELIEDEEIDLFSFIAGRVAEGFAKKEDDAFFKGDGTSTYGSFTGLLESSYVNEVSISGTTFASVDADDLLDMQDSTPSAASKNAKYYLHRTILTYIRKLKDTEENYIYQRPSGELPGLIWNKPYVLVESMPSKTDTAAETSFVLYGDLKKGCIFGYKGSVRAKRFDAGVIRNVADGGDINLITSDREAIRFVERVGYFQVIQSLSLPITKLTTAAASA